jgi:hypothetical protein
VSFPIHNECFVSTDTKEGAQIVCDNECAQVSSDKIELDSWGRCRRVTHGRRTHAREHNATPHAARHKAQTTKLHLPTCATPQSKMELQQSNAREAEPSVALHWVDLGVRVRQHACTHIMHVPLHVNVGAFEQIDNTSHQTSAPHSRWPWHGTLFCCGEWMGDVMTSSWHLAVCEHPLVRG